MLAQLVVPAGKPVESYRPPAPGRNESLEQLMYDWPFPGKNQFGCYLIHDNSPYSDIARGIECAVFEDFFGMDASVLCAEYAPYEASSRFLLVVDRKWRRPAGAVRIISNSPNGLKSLNDIAHHPPSIPLSTVREYHQIDDLDRCWDLGTLAVLPAYRKTDHLVSTMLYGLVYREGLRCNIEHAVAILDDHAYRQLRQLFAFPFVPIANSEPFEYLGAANSRACYMRASDIEPAVETFVCSLDEYTRRLLRPLVARFIYGEGLPEIVEVIAETGEMPRIR